MNLTECNCFPGNGGRDCPGYNPQLQLEGWFGQLADLNQDGTCAGEGLRLCVTLTTCFHSASAPREDHAFVRQKLFEYVQYLVKEYDVDAFRLDTAIYMPKDFLQLDI